MPKTSDKGLIFDAHQKLFLSFQMLTSESSLIRVK